MAVKITNLGAWELYRPDPVPPAAPPGAGFARRVGDGVDWYAFARSRGAFPAGALLATAIPGRRSDGVEGYVVSAVTRDPSTIFPPGAYLVQIEGVPESETKPHKLFEGQNFDPDQATIRPFPPLASPVITSKRVMWGRMTVEEAAALDGDLQEQIARDRRQFDDAKHIDHADPLFGMLRQAIAKRYGEDRAAEILAPSN